MSLREGWRDRAARQLGRPAGELFGGSGTGRLRLFALLVSACGALGLVAVMAATVVLQPLFPAIRLPFSPFGIDPTLAGLGLWIVVCLATSTGDARHVPGAPRLLHRPRHCAGLLGGPAAAAWVALIGTFQFGELRAGMSWLGVLANHGMRALCATVAAVVMLLVRLLDVDPVQLRDLIGILVATVVIVVMGEGRSPTCR